MRFYISYFNMRETKKGSSVKKDYPAHIRGWDVGVMVVPRDVNGKDVLDIHITGGSHNETSKGFLGTVVDTPEGPEFVPY